jgi:hypothetical protein
MKKLLTLFLLTIMIVNLTACSGTASADTISQTVTTASDIIPEGDSSVPASQDQANISAPITSDYDPDDLSVSVEDANTTLIKLNGNSVAVEGNGVNVSGTTVTITVAGVYDIQGILNDGQIFVDTQDAETVILVLNGAEITNNTSAPIYVANAEKVIITLADGTQNMVTDANTYYYPDESNEPDAAIFSNDDLTINGGGALTVNAVNDGIKGKDSVSIKDGTIMINSGADGIQSTNADETDKGYIVIDGGTFNITAGLDGIQAETSLLINGGNFTITTGGGSINTSTSGGGMWGGPGMEGNANKPAESAKALKAGVDVTVMTGTFNISSADDSLHSNGSLTINGGTFGIASGDDGLHADASLTVNGGEITISQSYEGIESEFITINNGTIHLTSSDDGFNAAGGADSSAVNGRPGQNGFAESGDNHLYINGGYIFVDAGGDELDSNGPFDMTGGTVIVNGPTNNGNGPLDYTGSFNITGGYLLAVGSSGMAQAPSNTSTQYAVMYNFDTMQAVGTIIHIETQSGQEILTFMPTKEYQSVLLSTFALQNGETYVVYTGGSSTGTITDGLYEGGIYTPGTQVASFTISAMVTSNGMMGGGPGGGGMPGGGPGGSAPGGGPGGMPPTQP